MNQRFDAGLRAVHLASLKRDLHWAELGVLGEVIMPTKWSEVRRRWRHPGNVVVTIHDLPPLARDDVFLSSPPRGPVGAGVSIAMRGRGLL